MEKIIELENTNTVSIIANHDSFRVNKAYFKNGNFEKDIDFSMCDDFLFSGFIDEDIDIFKNMNILSFHFDRMDPLFLPLQHLLNTDQKLVIDDDDTRELNKKYMQLSKNNDEIVLSFRNDKIDDLDKFNIFIKNIAFDLRSKIDDQKLDTKKRLVDFFNEMRELLYEKHHQITFEEYLLRKDVYDNTKEFIKIK